MITPQIGELILPKDCKSWEEFNEQLLLLPHTVTFLAAADILLISTLLQNGGVVKAGTNLGIATIN